MQIKLLVDGGEMKPGPTVGQQLGPLGINIGDVINKTNQVTSGFKGMSVPIVIDVDPKTKAFTIEVSSPPTSELLKKEMALEKGAADHKKQTVANASIEDVIKVTKVKYSGMLSKDLKAAVKSVLGTCMTIGIIVENKSPVEVIQEVEKGVYDSEIKNEKIETSSEKRAKLKKHLEKVIKEQEAAKAAEEAAKAAEEAAKEAAKTAAAGVAGAAEATTEGAEAKKEGAEGSELTTPSAAAPESKPDAKAAKKPDAKAAKAK